MVMGGLSWAGLLKVDECQRRILVGLSHELGLVKLGLVRFFCQFLVSRVGWEQLLFEK